MNPFETFEQDLRDALAHLYDPTYQPTKIIWTVTGCESQQGVELVQTALIRAIENLKPAPDVPPTARIRRIYDVLSCRYVRNLTQEEAAECLGITARHLRREQQEAVHVLARRLWEQSRLEPSSVSEFEQEKGLQASETLSPDAQPSEWHLQVRQELASLQKSAPGMVADVEETIRGAVKLGSVMTLGRGISLEVGSVPPNLIVAIHPSALRQILFTAVEKLAQAMSSGQITLDAEREKERVRITITGYPVTTKSLPNSGLIREILAAQGGSIEARLEDNRIFFGVELPSAGRVTVLVVDDNADLVHFYRRYIAGTRYQILHIAEGQSVFETIESSRPDIIVLDVMLPDIDGWELLTHLRQHPATRAIPVVVCSVVRRAELALALGATLYVPKPVRRQQFIQALDRVLSQASIRASKAQASNVATD